MTPKVYMAGPLFTAAERSFNSALAEHLIARGYDVWLPQDREPRDKTMQAIFEMDRDGIDWSDIVLACVDGSDPDSGTCWECGYAYARRKPVVLYRTDFRGASEGSGFAPFNLMLAASAARVVTVPIGEPMSALADLVSAELQNAKTV